MNKYPDTPVKLEQGVKDSLIEDIIGARNILNRFLDLAAHHGIKMNTRLIKCHNVGAMRNGIDHHYIVESLPEVSEQEQIEG